MLNVNMHYWIPDTILTLPNTIVSEMTDIKHVKRNADRQKMSLYALFDNISYRQ